jgi:hypothetical protein
LVLRWVGCAARCGGEAALASRAGADECWIMKSVLGGK